MNQKINNAFEFVRADYRSYPLRFIIEAISWTGALINTTIITVTVPSPPWLICYSIWVVGCLMCSWAAYTRKSTWGMVSCLAFAIIDGIGLIKILL